MYEIWTRDEYGIRPVAVFFDTHLAACFLGGLDTPWEYIVIA